MPENIAANLYLDLLKRSLTGTMYEAEPNHDSTDARGFVVAFTMHYIRGNAVTMLPHVRLDNIRFCVEQVLADRVPGDLIETGVWRGGGCIFMRGCLNALGGEDRVVWVADSFEGLPEPDPRIAKEVEFFNSPMLQRGYKKMAAGLEEVRRNFAAYKLLEDNVRFLQGWFRDTLPNAPVNRLAVMRLDGDYYDSTMDALRSLYRKLSPGGFVIIDDYGEDLWTDCRKAVQDFRAQHGVSEPIVNVDTKCAYWRKEAD